MSLEELKKFEEEKDKLLEERNKLEKEIEKIEKNISNIILEENKKLFCSKCNHTGMKNIYTLEPCECNISF